MTLLAQAHIRSMRMLTDATDVFVMTPHNELLSSREENEAYVLAQPGRCYTVYFTGEGDQSIELDLSAAKGALTLKWLDVVRSAWQAEASVNGGSRQQLKSPGQGQWMALIASEK